MVDAYEYITRRVGQRLMDADELEHPENLDPQGPLIEPINYAESNQEDEE